MAKRYKLEIFELKNATPDTFITWVRKQEIEGGWHVESIYDSIEEFRFMKPKGRIKQVLFYKVIP